MSTIQQHLEAFLLALASSTDNFAVGVGLGVKMQQKRRHEQQEVSSTFWQTNTIIAVCNAGGAFLATYFGGKIMHLDSLLEWLAPLLSSMAFSYLAWNECKESSQRAESGTDPKDEEFKLESTTNLQSAFSLALPMTLNNLAGGFVGGVAGISSGAAFFYALLASLLAMACGFYLTAGWYMKSSRNTTSSMNITAALYILLSLTTLYEAYHKMMQRP